MFKFAKVSFMAGVVAIAGCGDAGPPRVPITGTLTLDGEPLAFKSLTLTPIEGTTGGGASGYSDSEGKYQVLAMVPGAVQDFNGCPPGRYRVTVSEPLIPISDADFQTASKGEVIDSNEPAAAVFMPTTPRKKKQAKGAIPSVYASGTMSPLVIDVAEGNELIDLALASTAK
ncbi:carboxypeptidase-like regulatory domain-containing protein [Rosistilla oblonga]|uniref:Carboxypeptidase regulatory-like domain-containing protein n=1 Tax=Rosistilla oblonga TaxID=2527990 RepID=A0A518IUB9_9BACT|nr:carboxypeptidase-like regulatory domain-containing protein [Rosistilla oblonga]QDV56691.1 hypothetical protein Mal33_26890 [Rosistilla oblonga]